MNESPIVLITGAGKGLGRVLAIEFAARGVSVAANDLTPINLDQTISEVRSMGGHIEPYIADIASKLALQTMINAILDRYGRIDYLINTVNIAPKDRLLEMDEWDWRRVMDQNLTGPFLLTQSIARVMQAQGGGKIIHYLTYNPNSVSAQAGNYGLLGFIRSGAQELEPYHIQMNAVCSGYPEAQQIPNLPNNALSLILHLCLEKTEKLSGKIIQVQTYTES